MLLKPASEFCSQADFLLVLSEIKAPLAVLGAEIDNISPPELVEQFGEILAARTDV